MKFSYQWLAQLVPGLDVEPHLLERLITMKTAECDGVEAVGAHFGHVLTARILSVTELPNSKNKLVVVDSGDGEQKHVVCGAGNVRPGLIAAWIPPGAYLQKKLITSLVIDGVRSEGMLASAAELGINRDDSGVLELHDVAVGHALPELKPDWIIEIDNKSLTHRPDLWGHYGMAREVSAITRQSLRDPVLIDFLPASNPLLQVSIEDLKLCPRYSAVVIENVSIGPSPFWLQARLESIGLNPINNLVDITNYVLAELPQPMHAFDADKLQGSTIFVRLAREGESFKALNGETYELTTADLVIADEAGPVALAGVIGGADSAISATTTRVVLESANFQASGTRLTSLRHKLRTDASMRFEKSLDPHNTVRGLARALQLLASILPGARPIGGLTDVSTLLTSPPPISLPVALVSRKLGRKTSEPEVTGILSALGFGVAAESPGILSVAVPSWRATKDISMKDDLIEEIGRMIGYGEIVPVAPLVASVVPPSNPLRSYLRQIRSALAARGFTEVYNYSFVSEADVVPFGYAIADHLAVQNPIASDQTHLRKSLLPGLLKRVGSNVRHFSSFNIFEIGNEVHPGVAASLPRQVPHVAAVLYTAHANTADFFELKSTVEVLLPGCCIEAQASPASYEHPVRAAAILMNGIFLGNLFELHPALLQKEGIGGRAFVFDIDLDAAYKHNANAIATRYVPLRKFPTSRFDLSIIAGTLKPVADMESDLRRFGGDSIVSLSLVDQYSGPPLSDGEKSVSFHIEVGAVDRTLTTEQAGEIRAVLIARMREVGYELRV